MQFVELIEKLVNEHGQGTLADMVEVDSSTLSRFRSGQGTINITVLQKILDVAEVGIISRKDLAGYEDTLSFITDLWNRERAKRNGNGDGKVIK